MVLRKINRCATQIASLLLNNFSKRCWLFFVALLFSCSILAKEAPATGSPIADVPISNLPPEVAQTLKLIKQRGPYPYAKDGVVFGNYEGVLPGRKRGYYHEFTVITPHARNRGARRIITGGNPQTSGEYFYTGDHYRTFQRIRE
jgi:ribonuclease T1